MLSTSHSSASKQCPKKDFSGEFEVYMPADEREGGARETEGSRVKFHIAREQSVISFE